VAFKRQRPHAFLGGRKYTRALISIERKNNVSFLYVLTSKDVFQQVTPWRWLRLALKTIYLLQKLYRNCQIVSLQCYLYLRLVFRTFVQTCGMPIFLNFIYIIRLVLFFSRTGKRVALLCNKKKEKLAKYISSSVRKRHTPTHLVWINKQT